MSKLNRNHGFIAVIVVIMLALALVTAGAFLLSKTVPPKKIKATRTVVAEAKEAVTGFAAANKRLPSQTEFETLFRSADEWGIQLLYSASASLSPAGANLCMPSAAPALLSINGSNTGAFIIYSKGENRTDETNTAPSTFVIQLPSATYDDIAEFISLADLRKRVCHEMRITTESLPVGTEEAAYPSTTLEATDGTKPYSWMIISALGLPMGMNISPATGVISGTPRGLTPVATRNYPFRVRVTDAEGRIAEKELLITIKPNAPRITTGFLHNGRAGQAYSASLSGEGGLPGYSYSLVSGALPTNLALSSGGVISGTIGAAASGLYTFTVRITDSRNRTSDRRLTINVSTVSLCDPLVNTTRSPMYPANVGAFYLDFISYTGGDGYVSCDIISGTLPPGLMQWGCGIFGWPTTIGIYQFTTRVQDTCSSGSQTSDKATQIVVGCPLFTGWSSSLPTAHTCQAYPSGTISAFGGYSPYSWSLTGGALPVGIDFCSGNTSSTCSLVTPATGYVNAPSGSYSFNVRVNDSCPLGSQNTTNSFAISVQNNTGCSGLQLYSNSNNRSYTVGSPYPAAPLVRWPNGNIPITISPGNTYFIYTNPNGSGDYCPINFCQGLGSDSDHDCRIRLGGGCSFIDQ